MPSSGNTIQLYRGTAANLTSDNETLASGEVGIETDTLQSKTGDGSTAWTSLSYDNSSIERAASLGTAPSYGVFKIKSGPPDQLYVSMQKTGATWDWIPVVFAP